MVASEGGHALMMVRRKAEGDESSKANVISVKI